MAKVRRSFSFTYVFASFFGALMVAGAFAYYNYKFSQFKFIDFNKINFYHESEVFLPTLDNYTLVIYSSNENTFETLLPHLKRKYPIIAIDLHQAKQTSKIDDVIFISGETNSLLKVIQLFNIYDVPTAFYLKKIKAQKYKQNSAITPIE